MTTAKASSFVAPPLSAGASPADAAERAQAACELAACLRRSVGAVVLGQHDAIEQLLVALLAGGHALLVGVPGLAKTLLVRQLAVGLGLPFRRIQFTPDLMPSDIVGSDMLEQRAGEGFALSFRPGPVFANVLLADEINRTPPKTQAALLECMQEHNVTVGGEVHPLPSPFHVFATQNPLEQEGTYPLPEAQLDRFLLHIAMRYPDAQTELCMARGESRAQAAAPARDAAALAGALADAQALVPHVPVPAALLEATVRLVRSSRPAEADAAPDARELLAVGAGPRATQGLLACARARALVRGRAAVIEDDVRSLAAPVLRHRLLLSADGELAAGGEPMAQLDQLVGRLTERALGAP